MSNYEDNITRLDARQRELQEAQEKARIAAEAYEEAVREIQQSLPRITPDVIAAFREFTKAQDSHGELDSEHCPTAWKLIVQIGKLIDPKEWNRWDED